MPAIGDADHRPGNSTTHIFADQQAPPTPKVTIETVADGYSSGVDQGGDIDTGAIAGIAVGSVVAFLLFFGLVWSCGRALRRYAQDVF